MDIKTIIEEIRKLRKEINFEITQIKNANFRITAGFSENSLKEQEEKQLKKTEGMTREEYFKWLINGSQEKYSSTDKMWYDIKKEHEEKLEVAKRRLEELYQQFYSFKGKLDIEHWHMSLKLLGNVLAETSDIAHVRNSLYDEFELNNALAETSNLILNLLEQLKIADEDTKIILKAQIEYFKFDMQGHYWGESRLKNILSDEDDTPKR